MARPVIIHNPNELNNYKKMIMNNLEKGREMLQIVINEHNALETFQILKFEKSSIEPLSGESENFIEVINQSMSYIVSCMAVEYLYQLFPKQSFRLNWGNVSGFDIESLDGMIICECFAATSYRSNGKLSKDLQKLNLNESAKHKYEFFYDQDFSEINEMYYKEKYPSVTIVKFNRLEL